jgi:tetratricopeptide (TPR) repeat protein
MAAASPAIGAATSPASGTVRSPTIGSATATSPTIGTATIGVIGVISVALFAAGLALTAYGRFTRPVADADEALAAAQLPSALTAYSDAESRFDALPALRQLAASDYQRAVQNQLWALYRLERFDDLIAKSERSPEDTHPHFWSGLAFYAKARREVTPGQQLGWLTRAEDELRRAVEADPDDWDTKYDFELVARLASELRKTPAAPPKELLQLLRPQPQAGSKPPRRVG